MTITKLGRYDIVRVLGKGAMGMVYEARDPNLDRRVAIKTIKVENLSPEATADYEARFRTEARSAARLQHPNIVSVYDSERHGDTAYLVMEYVQGDDLKQHLDSGKRYSLEQSVRIVCDLLAALDYAHRQNIVHRDVKPANLLLVESSGRVKLTDFGVARIQDSGEATRTKGSMVGTLKYMSPEQVQGLPVDARADLFSAGIVLYQLLTGRRPFDGDGEFAIIHQIVSQAPPMPSSINPQLPAALDAVVARALAKSRDERFATAQEFAQALQEASGQVPDPTIVPPFSAGDQRAGGSTGSGALRSRSGTHSGALSSGEASATTVTQELELVYWKDIKDTDDPADLRGFLERFPQGIYADLARRRLRKLDGGEQGDPSSTRTAVARPLTEAAPVPADATVVQPVDSEATLVSPRPEAPPEGHAPTDQTAAPQPDQAPPAPPRPEPAAASAAPAAKPIGPKLVAALVLVLVLGVVALLWVLAPGGAPSGDAANGPPQAASGPASMAETAPAASAVASSPSAAPAVAPAAPAPGPVASATVAATSRAPAAAPRSTAASRAAPSAAAPAAAAPAATTVVPPAAPAAPTAPAAAPSSPRQADKKPPAEARPAAAGPVQACEGRVLLSYQLCLTEQCAKPEFARTAFCVERSANERAARARQGADNR